MTSFSITENLRIGLVFDNIFTYVPFGTSQLISNNGYVFKNGKIMEITITK